MRSSGLDSTSLNPKPWAAGGTACDERDRDFRQGAKILALGKNLQDLAHISTILESERHHVSPFGLVDDQIRDLHKNPIIDLIAGDPDGWES